MIRALVGTGILALFSGNAVAAKQSQQYLLRLQDLDSEKRATLLPQYLDVWESDATTALVYVSEEQRRWLQTEGIAFVEETGLLESQKRTKDIDGYLSFEEYEAAMIAWAADNPSFVTLTSLGKSIENRDIWMLKLSDNVATDEAEPEVFLISLQHCREWLAGMTLYGITEYFIDNYGTDPVATSLVNDMEMYIVLVANPDGYVYTHTTERLWRKNRRDNGDGTFGVDLNRNFPIAWSDAASSNSYNYGGTAPLSEPENLAVTNFLQGPDRQLVGLLNYHTYGTRVMHNWAYTYALPPNAEDLGDAAYDMAHAIKAINGQRMRIGRWSVALQYLGAGATVDYAQAELGLPAFTLELRPGDGAGGAFVPGGESIEPSQTENTAGAIQFLQWVRGLGLDDTPPVISDLRVEALSNTEATIRWSTDDLSSRLVEYGVSPEPDKTEQPDRLPSRVHEIRLTGLTPGTDYRARAVARNVAGLSTTSDALEFSTFATPQDITAPSAPAILWLRRADADTLQMRWLILNTSEGAVGARLYMSTDRVNYTLLVDENTLLPGVSPIDLPAPPTEQMVFFKLVLVDAAGNESLPGDLYPYRHGTESNDVLLVDGYDRWGSQSVSTSIGNHTFLTDHGVAVDHYGLSFDATTNNGIVDGDINLTDYHAVVWMLGEESTGSSTFGVTEQTAVQSLLNEGGRLFVSGSEIGYDLGRASGSSDADREFYRDYLGAEYVADDTNNYDTVGTGGDSIFGTLAVPFDSGGERIYRVSAPDEIRAATGSLLALQTETGRGVGIQRSENFGGGASEGRVVYISFPFETIFPESKRIEVMKRVLDYFQLDDENKSEEWMIY